MNYVRLNVFHWVYLIVLSVLVRWIPMYRKGVMNESLIHYIKRLVLSAEYNLIRNTLGVQLFAQLSIFSRIRLFVHYGLTDWNVDAIDTPWKREQLLLKYRQMAMELDAYEQITQSLEEREELIFSECS